MGMMKRLACLSALVLAAGLWQVPGLAAGEAMVATAVNFAVAAERIKSKFQTETGHVITLVRASTGKLAAQAVLGAPFDVLLAADRARPKRLIEDGHAIAGSQFTYAVGRLVLWSADAGRLNAGPVSALRAGKFRRLAIANPDVAPYGAAAQEMLNRLGLWSGLEAKLIYGENIQRAYAFAASGNAELALVALSFMLGARFSDNGAYQQVPTGLHAPIRQDAVLLRRGAGNEAAEEFLTFLKSNEAAGIMRELGYEAGQGAGK